MEGAQLGVRGRAAAAEFNPAVGEQVQHGDPFRDPHRVVDAEGQQHDAVAQPYVARACRQMGKDQFGRYAVGQERQKMMLDEPHRTEPKLVGQHHLLDTFLIAPLDPRRGHVGGFDLEEEAEVHLAFLSPRRFSRRGREGCETRTRRHSAIFFVAQPKKCYLTGCATSGSTNMSARLQDKVCLITGGASGIGRAAALAFAREGAIVAIADIFPGGEETAHLAQSNGGRAEFTRCDIAEASEVEALIASIAAKHGRLDCAFNNAGIEGPLVPMAEVSEELWDRIIKVDLKGVWLCLKHEVRQMLRQERGAIVNTSST